LNPQMDFEKPYKPSKEDLYENWNKTNLNASKDHFGTESCYYPLEESNEIWEHNFNRQRLQAEIGNEYFVSRIFFYKTFHDKKIVTLSVWAEHVPNILPATDYYLLVREYKRLFKTVRDKVLISRQGFLDKFGNYFDDYLFKDCKIIHPDKALKVAGTFNRLKSDLVFTKLMTKIEMENLYNAQP